MGAFIEWLKLQDCEVTCTQEDDGSGYAYFEVVLPPGTSELPEGFKVSISVDV